MTTPRLRYAYPYPKLPCPQAQARGRESPEPISPLYGKERIHYLVVLKKRELCTPEKERFPFS